MSEKLIIIEAYQRTLAAPLIGENFEDLRNDLAKIEKIVSPALYSFICNCYNAALNSFPAHDNETFGETEGVHD